MEKKPGFHWIVRFLVRVSAIDLMAVAISMLVWRLWGDGTARSLSNIFFIAGAMIIVLGTLILQVGGGSPAAYIHMHSRSKEPEYFIENTRQRIRHTLKTNFNLWVVTTAGILAMVLSALIDSG